jgi:hypothetical protein
MNKKLTVIIKKERGITSHAICFLLRKGLLTIRNEMLINLKLVCNLAIWWVFNLIFRVIFLKNFIVL